MNHSKDIILTYIYGTNESMYIEDGYKYSIGDTLIYNNKEYQILYKTSSSMWVTRNKYKVVD